MRLHAHIYLYVVAILLAVIACSPDVELCYDDHPHRSHIDFVYDWQEADVRPDSMRVIAYRRVNTLKYMMMVTARNEGNTGHILFPQEEIDETSRDAEGNTSLWLRNGRYEMLTYNGVPSTVDEELFDVLQTNETDPDSIMLKYKLYQNVDQTPLLAEYVRWVDSNPYSGYIVNSAAPIYMGKTILEVPVAGSGSRVECHFAPTVKTQKVNVEFDIDPKEEGIVIDEVQAEMSGVGEAIVLGSGIVTTERTGKVLFTPECSGTSEAAGRVSVKGQFNATGIVRSANQRWVTGPGILQLNVRTRITQDILTPMGTSIPHTYTKNFRACINLYHTLGETPSLVFDEELGGFVQSAPEITIRIGQVLEITQAKILSHSDSALDYWVDAGTVVLDI